MKYVQRPRGNLGICKELAKLSKRERVRRNKFPSYPTSFYQKRGYMVLTELGIARGEEELKSCLQWKVKLIER